MVRTPYVSVYPFKASLLCNGKGSVVDSAEPVPTAPSSLGRVAASCLWGLLRISALEVIYIPWLVRVLDKTRNYTRGGGRTPKVIKLGMGRETARWPQSSSSASRLSHTCLTAWSKLVVRKLRFSLKGYRIISRYSIILLSSSAIALLTLGIRGIGY